MSTQNDDGGPAFPQVATGSPGTIGSVIGQPGMSLRDWFAGQALAGELAAQNAETGFFPNSVSNTDLQDRANMLWRFADAMLATREACPPPAAALYRPAIGSQVCLAGSMGYVTVTGHTARGFTYQGGQPFSIPRMGICGTGEGECFCDCTMQTWFPVVPPAAARDGGDSARLDWLEKEGKFFKWEQPPMKFITWEVAARDEKTTIRQAIDAAMKGTP